MGGEDSGTNLGEILAAALRAKAGVDETRDARLKSEKAELEARLRAHAEKSRARYKDQALF